MTRAAIIIDNRPGLESVIEAHEKFIPKDWLVYQITNEQTNTVLEYNKLLTSKRFWRNMPDKVLIFQHDSMLLREGVDEFLEWDYVGAPWKFQEFGGNGGLSLRDSKAMLKVINQYPEWDMSFGNEDVYFSNALHQLGTNIAPREVCKKFSVESIFELGTVGYHQIDTYLSATECKIIKEQYNNWKL